MARVAPTEQSEAAIDGETYPGFRFGQSRLGSLTEAAMDPDTWVILIVPALAVIAIGDSLTGLSVSLSRKLGFTNSLWVHIVVLLICYTILIVGFRQSFPLYAPGATRDFRDVREHVFSVFVAPKLMMAEMLLIICCIVVAPFIAIKQKRSIILSVVAAILGNVGAIVWMIRERSQE